MSKPKKLKRVAVTLDETDPAKGYQRVSLVANPAIRSGWVALSAAPAQDTKRVHLSTEAQKQLLTGPVLIPDQDILRLDAEGNPYNIFFSVEQIEKIGAKLMAEGRTTETNDEHSVELTGNVVRELWIVVDPNNDKASALGLEVPAGTLMMTLHIPDADYWQTEIVEGNKTGFSIEGLFDFQEVKLAATSAKFNKMKNKGLRIQLAICRMLNIQLAQVELADGKLVEVGEDQSVKVLDDEGEEGEALADGEYELKGGGKLTVKDGKKVAAPAADEKEVEAAAEGAGADEQKPDTLAQAKEALAGVADATDAAALTAQVKKALELLGVTELSSFIKLEAVAMADGGTFNLNPITRLLTDANGGVVGTGYYACADGSYFKVNLDQYTYSIDKDTYDRSIKLSSVEEELRLARIELSGSSSTEPLHLSADNVELSDEQLRSLPQALSLTAQMRSRQG